MSKNEKRMIFMDIVALIMFSVVTLAFPFTRNNIFWLSFAFGIIAILVQMFVFILAFSGEDSPKSKFYGFPIARIGITYMIIQLVISLLFMVLATLVAFWIPFVLFVLVLGVFSLGFVAADATRDEIVRQDVKLTVDTACMQNLRSIIYPLKGQISDAECVKQLNELSDLFKYSDPVSSVSIKPIEDSLTALVYELQKAVIDSDPESVTELCKKITLTLTERNRLCKLNKAH